MSSRVKPIGVLLVWFVPLLAAACTSSPAQPSGVTAGDASIAAPTPIQPANGVTIGSSSQPVTLVAKNAVVTQGATPTYTFEVANDAGFTSKVQVKSGVTQGNAGQTSVMLDALQPSANGYFWHVRSDAAGTTGAFSAASKFTITQIGAPAPVSPASGHIANGFPSLVVSNASHPGLGSVAYRFEVSTSAAFGSIFMSGSVAETPGTTTFNPPPGAIPPPSPVPFGLMLGVTPPAQTTTLFWRATAIAPDGSAGSASATQSFVFNATPQSQLAAVQGFELWPGAQPTGANGQATIGGSWNPQILFYTPNGTYIQSPTLEMLQIFDLLDRGYDPDSAINWINGNGYFTIAQWYPPPDKAVIGLRYVYIAARNKIAVNGIWDVVLKTE